ncbi:helix-turn-helix domain-containing protein [Bacillus sp. FJAT-29814]|uniref:helix-turn-helix domain-containing protein n=1 Tax=Bacillus sp. FJAT-29814 TaxID=1729688 RepID=UPI000831D471|nr:helix-turn-helix domain-containing protein [Bacillus sp. FJAT-29814]
MNEKSLKDFLMVSDEYEKIDEVKLNISKIIQERIQENGLSIKKTAKHINGMGPAQVSRVLHGENYNIQTLIKILDYLDLELIIQKKSS